MEYGIYNEVILKQNKNKHVIDKLINVLNILNSIKLSPDLEIFNIIYNISSNQEHLNTLLINKNTLIFSSKLN